nr:MarR family winged helix-turn-helix transcriptional regulator [Ruficoccus amylovorans]
MPIPDSKGLPEVEMPSDAGLETLPLVPRGRYDLRILKSLRRIIRSVDVYSRRLAHEHGVTVPQLVCLLKLDELGALTLKELSEEVFLSPSTLVGIIDRLEAHGLIARRRSVRDRRKVRLDLTEKGSALVAASPSPLQDGLAQGLEGLPELERATIALSLEKILDLMEGMPAVETHAEAAPILETRPDLKA